MRVTFTKTGSRRYAVSVQRDHAPALAIPSAPGFDEYLPHDLLHFVAEAEWHLDGAVFGDLAAGGNARVFIPDDPALVAKMWRKRRRQPKRAQRLREGRRSEQLAHVLEHAWAMRGKRAPVPDDWADRLAAAGVDGGQVERVLPKLDELADRWHALDVGGSLTLDWPRPERRKH